MIASKLSRKLSGAGLGALALGCALLGAAPAMAQSETPLSVRSNFRKSPAGFGTPTISRHSGTCAAT